MPAPIVAPIMSIRGLRTSFHNPQGVVPAVAGVDLDVHAGRTLCVVGESGCGKSTVAMSVLQLVQPPGRIEGGQVWWQPPGADTPVDLVALDSRSEQLRQLRGGGIGMIFQDATASLSPLHTVGHQLTEAIRLHRPMSRRDARAAAIEALRRVEVPQPERRIDAYPLQLSGGMCQRVMIATALACDPALVIADEPTTALDVTTQARILDLFVDLQARTGLAIVFITHDLGVVAEIADDVAVIYLGTVVERGTVDEIFHDPRHPYTQALLRSVPTLGGARQPRLDTIAGVVPHAARRPPGCPFHPRCDRSIAGVCDTAEPPVVRLGGDRTVQCVLEDRSRQEDRVRSA